MIKLKNKIKNIIETNKNSLNYLDKLSQWIDDNLTPKQKEKNKLLDK
jgi:hypothetical protein